MVDTLSATQIKPLPGYVLIQMAVFQKQTISGIYLPDSSNEKLQYGVVLAVGESVINHGIKVVSPVKVKDKVMYKKDDDNSSEFKAGGEEYQFLKFEDLLAVIK